ncbi:MAG: hypothetical protein ACL7BU_15840 [Candidatus Phlomobacter fragariae]
MFNETIQTLRDSNGFKIKISDLITNEEKINDVNQLTTLPLGTLVIFHKTDYEVSNVIMSIVEKVSLCYLLNM